MLQGICFLGHMVGAKARIGVIGDNIHFWRRLASAACTKTRFGPDVPAEITLACGSVLCTTSAKRDIRRPYALALLTSCCLVLVCGCQYPISGSFQSSQYFTSPLYRLTMKCAYRRKASICSALVGGVKIGLGG